MITDSTARELRKTGISVIGDVRWGTHFCYFYETKQDLLDTLVLYFKAGLESKEFCLWVVSQALSVEEAKHALGQAVPDLEGHLAEGAIEIHSHDEWYLCDGRWDSQRVLQSWREKLNQTSANGYAGLRASGDGGWVQNDDWMVFREYERQVNTLIADQRSIILCTYPLTASSGDQVFDAAHIHQVAVARRNGSWEMIETPELKQVKAKIKRLNEELEQKVEERTRDLAATNEAPKRQIIERKEVGEALNAQALRYKTLMATSTDSIYVLDEKGDLQEANPAFLRRRGYTAAEVKGLNVADWEAQWRREQLQERLRKLIGKSAVFETRHRCKDGSVFDVEVCATSVQIDGEQLFFCVTRDITERKKAEFALRQLAQVSAASSDYIALIGRDFRYQFVNDTYLKARGLHLDDMIGRHMKEIVGQERFEQLGRPQVEACLRGEEVESFEWTDFRSDLRCFLHVKVSPLREPDGTISGAVMSGRDITARHEAEQAQRESEERFRELAENVDDFFWLTDLQHEEILYVSPAYERIWGRTRASLLASQRSWRESLHPEDRERILAVLSDGHPRGTPGLTFRIVQPDGSVRWVHSREFPVKDADGEVVRVAGIVEDITERKRAELALDERLRFETLLTELSAAFASLPTTSVDREIDKWLQNLVEFLDLDRAIFDQVGEDGMTLLRSHSHTARGIDSIPLNVANDQSPWITEQILRGITIKWSRIPDDIPEQALKEKEFAGRIGAKSVLSIPVCIGGAVICAVSFTSMRNYRDWSDEMVARLRLVGEIFANAIARKRAEEALFQRQAELNEAQRLASIGSWECDLLGNALTWSDELDRIYGFERKDLSSPDEAYEEAVHPDDRARRTAAIAAAFNGGPPYDVEFRIIRPDKSVRFVHSRGQLICDEARKPVRMIGMAQDITERKRAAKELEKANHRLRSLSRRLFEVQEAERRHLARELHDEIGQALTAAKINLQSVTANDIGATSARVQETTAILDRLLGQVRKISLDLRPSMLDDLGLVPALRSLLDQQGRCASIAVRFSAENIPEILDPEIQTTCFRMAQEAITNAVRHARATRVDVDLRCKNDELHVSVRDNGIGFDVEATRAQAAGLGLIGIKERAALLSGSAKITSSQNQGTTIEVSLPLQSKR